MQIDFAKLTSSGLTPISIKNNRFLKLILLEQTPLLTCFGFETRQKWLLSRRINLRKRLFLIDVGVGGVPGTTIPRDQTKQERLAAPAGSYYDTCIAAPPLC